MMVPYHQSVQVRGQSTSVSSKESRQFRHENHRYPHGPVLDRFQSLVMNLKANEHRVRAGRPTRAAESVNLRTYLQLRRALPAWSSIVVLNLSNKLQSPYFLPFLSLPAESKDNGNRSIATAMPATVDTKSIRCLVSSNFSCVKVNWKRLFLTLVEPRTNLVQYVYKS
jgi:hypothetical protein